MAASHFPTTHYSSTHLVESAGGIVFSRRTPRRMCILWHSERDEYLLAKGRRDHGESRAAAALREVREEAGASGLALLPVRLESRTTPAALSAASGDGSPPPDPNLPDEVRVFESSTDPFMCSVRELGDIRSRGPEVKLIWWYIMQADDEQEDVRTEEAFERRWVAMDQALTLLTFKGDREIAARAIQLVNDTYPNTRAIAGL